MPIEPVTRRSVVLGATGLLAAQSSRSQSRAQIAPAGSARFDIERFVDDVRNARAGNDAQDAIEALLRRAVEKPSGVIAAIGEPSEAGIHTLFRGDDVTILNVVWAPMMVLLPHNHNMWASLGIYTGREDNILWEQQGRRVAARRAVSLSEQQVFGLSADAIHSVTNPIGRLTGAIHIYGGDFFAPGRSEWDAETLEQRPFDLDAARAEFRKASQRFSAAP